MKTLNVKRHFNPHGSSGALAGDSFALLVCHVDEGFLAVVTLGFNQKVVPFLSVGRLDPLSLVTNNS